MTRKTTAELPLKVRSKLNVIRTCPIAADLPMTYILDLIAEMEERGTVQPATQDQIQKSFGDKVRKIRREKGFSQEDLALFCGLDRSFVGSVERGERNISLVNICKIARALDVPAGNLLTEAPGVH